MPRKNRTQALSTYSDNAANDVVVVVGGNDCSSDRPCVDILCDFLELMHQAKRVAAERVVLSSVLPRLTGEGYMEKLDELNNGLHELCTKESITFINNEENFMLQNGQTDDSLYVGDKVHLTDRGLRRLLSNLDLTDKVLMSHVVNNRQEAGHHQGQFRSAGTVNGSYNQHQRREPWTRVGKNKHRQNSENPQSDSRCFRCAERGHMQSSCRHTRKVRCHSCHRLGHKAKFCSDF